MTQSFIHAVRVGRMQLLLRFGTALSSELFPASKNPLMSNAEDNGEIEENGTVRLRTARSVLTRYYLQTVFVFGADFTFALLTLFFFSPLSISALATAMRSAFVSTL